MKYRDNIPNPDQLDIFAQPAEIDILASQIADHEVRTSTVPVSIGPDGSYVNIKERADCLIFALGKFGLSNQRKGFGIASEETPAAREIWARYRRNTPFVQLGAARNAETYRDEAKKAFWQATGLAAMRGLSYVDNNRVDATGRKLWRDFTAKYEHTSGRRARDGYKKKLSKFATDKSS